MQAIDRTQRHSCSHGALLVAAAFVAALAFVAPGEAFAACGGGTGGSTGAKPPSAGTGGTHSGSTPSAGSTGTGGCGVNTTTSALSGVGLTPSLTGVHGAGGITGNGGKRNGSTSGNTANTITATTHNTSTTSNVTNAAVVHTASGGGAGGGHSFHVHRHP